MKKPLLAAALGLSFAMPQAEAALFNFSYTAAVGTLSGVIDGTLQGDNNTVIVTSVLDFLTVNGVPGPSLPFVISWDAGSGLNSGALPTLTLDGSYLDFAACEVDCISDNGFALGVGNLVSAGGFPAYAANPGAFGGLGGGLELFNAASYSLTPAAVPVPATLPLLAIGGLGLAARRRKAA
jgi:hypothetical protein